MEVDYKILGLSVGVFLEDVPGWVLRGDVGRRLVDDPTPVQGDDRFPLLDTGRSIVATLAARIVERGDVLWTTTIGEVFHDSGLISVNPAFRNSTILDLLVHSGRIPTANGAYDSEEAMDFIDSMYQKSNYTPGYSGNPGQRREVAQFILESDFVSEKGVFSDFTYSIAVAMMEAVTGEAFATLLLREVLEPLQMNGCGVGPATMDPSIPPVQPWAHFAGPWGVYNLPLTPGLQGRSSTLGPSSTAPDLGLHCSLDSWKSFLMAHLTLPEDFLSAETWNILQTKQGEVSTGGHRHTDYAPGWMIYSGAAGRVLYHEGDDGKSHSVVYLFVKGTSKTGGLVLTTNTNIQEGMIQQVGVSRILEHASAIFGDGTTAFKLPTNMP